MDIVQILFFYYIARCRLKNGGLAVCDQALRSVLARRLVSRVGVFRCQNNYYFVGFLGFLKNLKDSFEFCQDMQSLKIDLSGEGVRSTAMMTGVKCFSFFFQVLSRDFP